jgi:hypothetical protein
MSISGQQTILIGLPNESAGSDSLYAAFTKINTNFTTLFACASPYNTFVANTGIEITSNANTGVVNIRNSGINNIIAGTNIVVGPKDANGNVTISSTGGGNGSGGSVTSVALTPASNTRLTVTGSPITSSGTMLIDLATTGVTQGSYINPSISVDSYGRITTIANGASTGSVTSVGILPGNGIQVLGGPITSNGNITINNTGVTRITAGSGILLSGSNGAVTISSVVTGGTVTSVGITSSTLTVSGSPVTLNGTISVNLPSTFAGTLTTPAQPYITSLGTLTSLLVTGNITGGNINSSNEFWTSSEDLLNGAAANLSVIASYFTTSTAETATLAAGTNGQIKSFMMVGNGGDMVITVSNAGWKSSGTGTITFSSIGQSCLLLYTASKWFCIGNNGVAFA